MTIAFRSGPHHIQRIDGTTAVGTYWSEAPTKSTFIKHPDVWYRREVVERPLSVTAGIKGGGTTHWLIVEGQYVLAIAPKAGGPMIEVRPEILEPMEVAS